MKSLKFVVAVLCAAALLVPVAVQAGVNVGDMAPDFELPLYGSDKPFKLSSLAGQKAVVLAIVQSACSSCQSELQVLNGYVGDSDKYEVFAVNVDARGGTERWEGLIKTYIEKNELKMGFLVDPKYSVGRAFGIGASPGTIVIDKDGKVIEKITGFIPGETEEALKKAIGSIK